MSLFDTHQLSYALAGMPYPARRWQMVTWADFNCASSVVREALHHLPDQEYTSPQALRQTIAEIERRAAAVHQPPR